MSVLRPVRATMIVQSARPRSQTPSAHRRSAFMHVFGDAHFGAVAIGLIGFDRCDPIAGAADADAANELGQLFGTRREVESPRSRSARELDPVKTVERGKIARQRGADAFDEGGDLG